MIICAIDQATTTGWAVGSPDNRLIASGSFRAQMNIHHFPRFWTEKLKLLLEEYDVEHLAVEQPFVGRHLNSDTVIKLYGMYVLAHLVAGWHGIGTTSCNIEKWRKHFFAERYKQPRKGRGKFFKKLAIDECTRRGWPISGHDEAEACGILDYAIHRLCPETRAQQSLFAPQ